MSNIQQSSGVQGVATSNLSAPIKSEYHSTGSVPATSSIGTKAAGVERAIGQAQVDTSFLPSLQADTAGVKSSMAALSALEGEKAAQDAVAQAALVQAGLAAMKAAEKEEELRLANEKLRREMEASQAELRERALAIKAERETLAAHDKLGAEIEVRGAAKAKAEEAAAIEAARKAAAEVAEADELLHQAEFRKAQALEQQKAMAARSNISQQESAAATQRAATLTALAEAHSREAKLAEAEIGKSAASLASIKPAPHMVATEIPVPVIPVGVPVAAAPLPVAAPVVVPQKPIVRDTVAAASTIPATGGSGVSSGSEFYPLHTHYRGAAQPAEGYFPYILNVRIASAQLSGSSLPKHVVLRIKAGTSESRTDRVLDTTSGSMWNVEGFIPIRDASELVQICLLDGTDFERSGGLTGFNWESGRVLGQLHLDVSKLVDGHWSRDNKLRLDGVGGNLFTCLHMDKWGSSSGSSGAGSGDISSSNYGWKQQGADSWLFNRNNRVGSSGAGPSSAPVLHM